ncbi:tetratricopeptide repeat protein, partial [Streptomyces lasiicapitis]|uniref:tetratricopeptide repeat protein n=1 Tax=Streptomyces lasiicapitis TaxID=1923961 RepID=UPI00364FF3BC
AAPEYRLVTAGHVAALAAVDSPGGGRAAPDGAAAVSAYLLARERAHWETLHANKRVLITPDAFGQVVYTAAMTSALSHREALGVLARIGVGSSEHADQILKDHALSYPAEEGAGGTVLEPLYPDRLAEDFLALSVAGHGIDGYAPDPWALDAPRRLLDGESPPWLRRVLATLVATAARWPHVRSAQLRPLLLERPELGVAAGGATLAALSEIADLDPDVLEAIEAHLPDGFHTDLNSGAAALAQRLVGHRLARTHDPEEQARLLNALAQRQSHAGLHDQALKSGQRAMEIRRSMSAAHTDTGEPSFAVVLCDVGVYLAKDGQFADALAATDQAVRLLRGLRDEQPGRHDDALALALSNYAADLATEGHWAEALDIVQEAVEIRRRLAVAADRSTPAVAADHRASAVAADRSASAVADGSTASVVAAGPIASAAQRAPLAAALANLAICLSRAGRREEACAAAEDAVAIQRDLARTNPHTHEPALASALVNLSRRLTHVSRHTHAREAAHEAVAVLRRLAHVNPAAYEEDLAVALLNLGACLAPLNHRAETCGVLEETAAIRRRLAARNPRQYEPALAASLESLGLASFRAGRHNRAFVAWSEAIELRGRFATAGGEREQADLAGLLCTVAWMHLAQGRELPRALKVIEEAVELLWPLARKPGPLGARLVEAVDIHARVLTALDHPAEAAEVRRRLMRFQRGDLDHGGGPAATTHGVGDWNGSS